MTRRFRWTAAASVLFAVGVALVVTPLAEAQRRGGGRGGGGGGGGARISRSGPAQGGSMRRGGYQGRGGGSYGGGYEARQSGARSSRPEYGETRTREDSWTNRRGETIDYSGSATRTEDGIERQGSWQSSSGASGGGTGSVKVEDGRVQGAERSRHVETADGETGHREISSQREGDHVVREGSIETSTGIDAESKGKIKKTDDGYVARGAVVGENGAAAGTIARKGDEVAARGVATDGDRVAWGRAHCNGQRCYGGTVHVDVDRYYAYPYYYYPYYYYYYSCPYGTTTVWRSRYGTSVYGCSNVTVISTTVVLGASSSASTTQITSTPVLAYEVSPETVVYASDTEPDGVYSEHHDGRYYWSPGDERGSEEVRAIDEAVAEETPTANSTVITYTLGEQIVYLTNERPAPGIYSEASDELFAWIPGVSEPTQQEHEAIATALRAHEDEGAAALDREARKLQEGHPAPPSA